MSESLSRLSSSEKKIHVPTIHISYECAAQKHTREADTYYYGLACSIRYPAVSGHLSMKVTGQNTYRRALAREVPFTRHEAGATTYVDLLEDEHLEVRIVEEDGSYSRAVYCAHKQELVEQYARHVASTIQRIDADNEEPENVYEER